MILKSEEGWTVLEDHSIFSHSDAIIRERRIDIDLAGLPSQEFIRPYLIPGTVAIDVGAHLGTFTIPMMRALRADGLVLAYEPDAELCLCIEANIAKEQKDNPKAASAQIIQAAVGDYNGMVPFRRNTFNIGASQIDWRGDRRYEEGWQMVKVLMLDDLHEHIKEMRLSFIKIDCEGSEIDVIRGARRLLHEQRPTLFVEINQEAIGNRRIAQGELEAELMSLNYHFEPFPSTRVGCGLYDIICFPN